MWLGADVTAVAHDDADASTIAASVRVGSVSARLVVDAALARIAGHRTNAVVTMCAADARAAADGIDELIARGVDPGPFAGVPFTVKDTIAVGGVRATGGSLLFADNVAGHDAEVVRRLRAAGAIVVGKTNCPEFALQPRTDNRIFGPTAHPRDATRSPGGSSGGCAAAVAGALVPFSIGGDYGGSVRYPASCTGIYGLRPTWRAVPTTGHVPDPAPGTPRARFQTIGPLARTARDIGLVFDVMRGSPSVGVDLEIGRVAVVRNGWESTEAVAGAVDRVADRFADAGYEVIDIDAGPFVEAAAVFAAWRATDDYADLRALAAGREGDLTAHIAQLLATPPTPADLEPRLAAVARAVESLLSRTPIVVLPVARVGVVGVDATTVDIGGTTESIDALQVLAPSRAVSVLGLPALAVPVGNGSDGFPVGVQLVGRARTERDLVGVATALVTGASAPPG